MADDIQLLDYPEQLLVSDEEVQVGRDVRTWTWINLAHLLNYLNHYAQRVMPWTRWHETIGKFEFVFPVDTPDFTSKYLIVVVAVTGKVDGAGNELVKVKTSTSGATWYSLAAAVGAFTSTAYASSEADTTYLIFKVPVTGGKRELVTVMTEGAPSAGARLDGFGAWQLPSRQSGYDIASSASGGVALGAGAIRDTVDNVVSPTPMFAGEDIDVDLADALTCLSQAWLRNRRIIGSYGCAADYGAVGDQPMTLYISGAGWQAPMAGPGIFVPAYLARRGDTYRTIRAACRYRLEGTAGEGAAWRVHTSRGNFPSDAGAPLTSTDLEWSPFGTPFDPDANGILIEVGLVDEWVQIEMVHDGNIPSDRDPWIYQVILWEDGPGA